MSLRNPWTFLLTVAAPVFAAAGALVAWLGGSWLDGVLAFGWAMTVAALVVSVFSQKGRIVLSPQREVAIATGQADRRTAFEVVWLRPIMLILLSLSHSLALPRLKNWLRGTLVAEGNPNYYTPEEYLAVTMAAGLGVGLALALLWYLFLTQISFLALLLGFLLGAGVCVVQLRDRSARRLREISRRVPYALDLVSLAMGAGATFTEAVRTVVHEQPEDPFNVELRTVLAEMELGATRRQALLNLADRIPLDNLRSIIASIVQAEELGTPLSEVLHVQASLLRMRRSVRAENLAAKAGVRILIPAMLIVMAVILALFAPAILRFVRRGLFG